MKLPSPKKFSTVAELCALILVDGIRRIANKMITAINLEAFTSYLVTETAK